ncbi:NAD(P)-binding protein [Meredithblackwellia eburnea MCA 4105]
MAPVPKTYDIIIWGATGFTGQLCVKYLLESYKTGVKWAVGARSKDKLTRTLKEAGVEDGKVDVIIADASDEASLVSMVKQTKVVVSLVGPFMRYGIPLVKACAENGIHYVDLTGEAPFVAKTISDFARPAVSTRAVLINSCGFDSVPSDLAAYLAVQQLKKAHPQGKVGKVTGNVLFKGGMSGGTLATLWDALSQSKEDRKISQGAYSLSPVKGGDPSGRPTVLTKTSYKGKTTWGSFWFMSVHNEKIVRRSWGILETASPSSKVLAYGPDFGYCEVLQYSNVFMAVLGAWAWLSGFAAIFLLPPLQWALKKYGPQPGEGPSPQMQRDGWFSMRTVAKTTDKQHETQVTMHGKGDPGYSATAKMITECALALALDYERLPPMAHAGGPLTPATALGDVLVERLEKTGYFTFTIEDRKTK